MRTRRITAVAAGAGIAITLALAGTTAVSATTTSFAQSTWAQNTSFRPNGAQPTGQKRQHVLPGGYKHLVVIYQENHSFDNLYGSWGSAGGQDVVGIDDATPAQITQVAQNGTPYICLPQNDVNLMSPPLPNTCQDPAHGIPASNFTNDLFRIDDYIAPGDRTCPAPGVFAPTGVLKDSPGALPGGCTRDLVHRFYQEQYQIDGGKQDRYTTGSDAIGLTQGVYDTTELPIYRYLHSKGAPKYVIADHFFQAAFGGSFLNHQWLIAARTPVGVGVPGAPQPVNSVLDGNGMVNNYPQYTATGPVTDGQLTKRCSDPAMNDYEAACGGWAVNTVQPASRPFGNGARIALIDDAVYANIGDRLSEAGISWNWYSGGWDAAAAGSPGAVFQYHHQPFNYFKNFAAADPATGTPEGPLRSHLKDETELIEAARAGTLPTVSFVKPYGTENEHPGYASEPDGSDHLVDLLEAITNGGSAGNTLVVVTYDEFGGQWDHVSPPAVDAWGPGTRIPALVISRSLKHSGVDHTVYDTTSILATIERSFGLAPLSTRDAAVNDLSAAVAAGGR
jgi:acid phosphatase